MASKARSSRRAKVVPVPMSAEAATFVAEIGGGVLELLATWSVYVLIFSAILFPSAMPGFSTK